MGADQSSTRGSSRPEPATTEKKTCYYELLGVSRTATDDEIKKAYRRKALELHPDRNYHNVENATKLFAEIQTANEVLSDPQERAWYDSHRDAILNNESANEYTQGQNVQVTSSTKIVNLISKFNSSTPFTDAPTGFYGSLRQIFQKLADEELAACEWEGLEAVDYPDFGSKEDIDNYEEVVRPFYAVWTSFSTSKTFSWKEIHRLSEAPDRYIRRLMEKENKQLRDKAIREFNETVRTLALFARKRDPRYKPNTQSEVERQKALREASAAQAKRARAANAAKFAAAVVPEWSKSRNDGELEDSEDIFSEDEDEEEEEEVILRCDFCNKTFKSEQQFEAHEKSKKHTKIMQQVKRQMQKENKKFGLDESMVSSGISSPAIQEPDEPVEDLDQEEEEIPEKDEEEISDTEDLPTSYDDSKPEITTDDNKPPTPQPPSPSPSPSENSEEDEDYAPRSAIADRLTSTLSTNDPLASSTASLSISESSTNNQAPTLGKAKAKRAKKLAAQQASATGEHICGVCKEVFASKTKLFKHVREEGHAMLVGGGESVGGGEAWENSERGKGGKKGKKKGK